MSTPHNILITSISKKIPLIKAVRKALENIGSGKIFGGDSNFSCIGRYFVDEFWLMPFQGILTIDEIIDFCKQKNIRAIIPTRDGELPFFAKHKEQLNQEGIACLVPSKKTVELCLDKFLFYTFLEKNKLPAIPTAKNISEIDAQSYVVKECFGAGSVSIGLDLTLPEAKEWDTKLKHPIYQPYIHGTEYSLDLYIDHQGSCLGSIVRERELVCDGESQVTVSVHHPEIDHLCRKAAELLGIRGPAVFQVLSDRSKHLHLIECNPRFGGASTLSVMMGLKIFDWFFQESFNLPLTPFHRPPNEMRQVRYPEDIVIDIPDVVQNLAFLARQNPGDRRS